MAAERRRNRQDPINGGRPSVCRTCPGGIAALSLRPSRILFSRNESTPLRLLLAIQATRFLLLTEYIVIMYPRAVSNLLRDHLNVFSIVVIYQPIVIVSSRRIFLFFSFIYIYIRFDSWNDNRAETWTFLFVGGIGREDKLVAAFSSAIRWFVERASGRRKF